jgi:hypothetical protein
MIADILIRTRNLAWRIRRRINRDAFETGRSADYCETVFLLERGLSVESFVERIANVKLVGALPLKDCVLQYEESGQLCSFHWFLDDKMQFHMRIFMDDRSDFARANVSVIVHGHTEIRPDYDPVAHVRGKEFAPACELVSETLSAL